MTTDKKRVPRRVVWRPTWPWPPLRLTDRLTWPDRLTCSACGQLYGPDRRWCQHCGEVLP